MSDNRWDWYNKGVDDGARGENKFSHQPSNSYSRNDYDLGKQDGAKMWWQYSVGDGEQSKRWRDDRRYD